MFVNCKLGKTYAACYKANLHLLRRASVPQQTKILMVNYLNQLISCCIQSFRHQLIVSAPMQSALEITKSHRSDIVSRDSQLQQSLGCLPDPQSHPKERDLVQFTSSSARLARSFPSSPPMSYLLDLTSLAPPEPSETARPWA